MLNDSNFLRYSPQMLLKEIGYEGQKELKKSNVLIIGIGGLGVPAALYLASAGIGNIILSDYDVVNLSDLQRQIIYRNEDIGKFKVILAQSFLKKLNPNIKISIVNKRINHEIIDKITKNVNLVLDCTDNIITRQIINASCVKYNIPLISASANEFLGQLMFITPPWKYGCYHCIWPDNEYIDNFSCQSIGIIGPIVGIMGALQALETIKWIINPNLSKTNGKLLLFDGYNNKWDIYKLQSDKKCFVCQSKS